MFPLFGMTKEMWCCSRWGLWNRNNSEYSKLAIRSTCSCDTLDVAVFQNRGHENSSWFSQGIIVGDTTKVKGKRKKKSLGGNFPQR
jgi:hypothetical protein